MPFACTLCDKPAELVRVAYTVNGKLFSGVPIRVCTDPDCVVKRGGTVVDARHLTPPPSETTMLQAVKTVVTEPTEYDLLRIIFDDWVREGRPGHFSDFIGSIEDMPDGT